VKRHLNTLFVTTQDAYLAKEGEAVVVRVDHEPQLRVPLHNLGGIVCFGRVNCSPPLMGLCAENGVAISFLTEFGRFRARVVGFTPGNVLLRRQQYRLADDPDATAAIARPIVAAKIANARAVLSRARRDYPEAPGADELAAAAQRLATSLDAAQNAGDADALRGIEGEAANTYFGVFNHLLTNQQDDFTFKGRSRRPPLDNVNALLSFLYAMLTHDARAACEAAGLDAAVGYLHRDRPGRAGLALENGAVQMTDETRKAVLTAYQKRKQETITHPFLGEKTTVGLVVHLEARLLARHLRGELDTYPASLWK